MTEKHLVVEAEKEFLVLAVTDWTRLDEAQSLARHYTGSGDWQVWRDFCLVLLGNLMRADLVVAGDFTDDRGFRPWNLPAEDALRRIRERWDAIGTELEMGDVCWFAVTPMGREIGEVYEAEENAEHERLNREG
ncbi:hypothetical protein [Nocardiopsis baichengensis]|uniref:hypothetical protein n=1 Tax=Nocardiopsis baichengensis TaxID=280240 RepID=UPI00034690DD|nr:hypothetical protein [Nocardiopsis baichengensis]